MIKKEIWKKMYDNKKKVIEIPYKSGTALIKCKEILKQNEEKKHYGKYEDWYQKNKKKIQEVERKQMNGKTKIQGKIK